LPSLLAMETNSIPSSYSSRSFMYSTSIYLFFINTKTYDNHWTKLLCYDNHRTK